MIKKLWLSSLAAVSVLSLGCSAYTEEVQVEEPDPVVVEEVKVEPEPQWVGADFNENEEKALQFFQDYGIKDRMALAVILGNIKQESNFNSNICEGGARIAYEDCVRGGYGLIQWTTTSRYDGLGRHAKKINGNPSNIDTQLSYLVTEYQWAQAEEKFRTPDKSLDWYMDGAYWWLGWGIYGNRGYYSQQYFDRLSLA